MATTTTNLGLTQPDEAEGYDVAVFNANADIIDNAIGDTSGKVDAVKTDTEEIKSTIGTTADAEGSDTVFGQLKSLQTALNTANQNIATLLTQNGSVKAIDRGQVMISGGTATTDIPSAMNTQKVIVLIASQTPASSSDSYAGVTWTLAGSTITFSSVNNTIINYQLIEFY